jgi:hypothetical protein
MKTTSASHRRFEHHFGLDLHRQFDRFRRLGIESLEVRTLLSAAVPVYGPPSPTLPTTPIGGATKQITSTLAVASPLHLDNAAGQPVNITFNANTLVVAAATWCPHCHDFINWLREPAVQSRLAGLDVVFAFGDESARGKGTIYDPTWLQNDPGQVVFLDAASRAKPTTFPEVYDPLEGDFSQTTNPYTWINDWLASRGNGSDLGSDPSLGAAAPLGTPASPKDAHGIAASPLGGVNSTGNAAKSIQNPLAGRPATPQAALKPADTGTPSLASSLDVIDISTMNGDPTDSPFYIVPYSSITNSPNYAWVSGLQKILVSSFYAGVVENLTLEAHGVTGLDYAPTRISLDTVDRTAVYEFSQAITDPERLLITASEGGDKAYFRLDVLPGDVDQSGMIDGNDISYEDFFVSQSQTDPYWIAYFDVNNDGVVDLNDENFIQARIDEGKINLPDPLAVRGNGNFGNVVVNSTQNATVTLSNWGTSTITDLGLGAELNSAFSFPGYTFPGTGGTCGSTLAVGQSGTVVVSFHPTIVGSYSNVLQIPYTDGTSYLMASFPLSGVSVAPAQLSISNLSTLYFENNGGSSSDTTFTLTNTGQWPATNIAAATANLVYPGAFGTATPTLAPGASCTMAARFDTGSGPVTLSPTLSLSYDSGNQTTSVTAPTTGLDIVVTGGVLIAQPSVFGGDNADIQAGRLVFDYSGGSSPAATIQSSLAWSYDNGKWDRGQFRSTTAAANGTTLGWKDDAGSSQVTVVATIPGDFNLDGAVDNLDRAIWFANAMTGTKWAQGDANYDGSVDGRDRDIVMANLGRSMSSAAPSAVLPPIGAVGANSGVGVSLGGNSATDGQTSSSTVSEKKSASISYPANTSNVSTANVGLQAARDAVFSGLATKPGSIVDQVPADGGLDAGPVTATLDLAKLGVSATSSPQPQSSRTAAKA